MNKIDENKQKDWENKINKIVNEFSTMRSNLAFFNVLAKQYNKKELKSDLWEFITRNYQGFMTMCIRRQLDQDKRDKPISLCNLLDDIKNYEKNSATSIEKDIEEIKKIAEPIKDHGDKRIAHHDKKDNLKKEPSFNDINLTVNIFEKIIKKYYLLITCSSIEFSND